MAVQATGEGLAEGRGFLFDFEGRVHRISPEISF